MGVPGFYRWLCQRYPLIRKKLSDPSRPIFNNIYLDINGIIHEAITTTNFKGPELTNDLLSEIYRCIDLQVQILKPTDLIFIASDGVAPLAKATQQRERRFSSDHVPGSFDHCAITPGTQFLYEIEQKLIEFFNKQKSNDLIWSKAKIIYSGFFVPGEGEHKIINFIREGRSSPDWNPNIVHCIPSGDADLLFLSLQTHDPNFIIIHQSDLPFVKRDASIFEAKGSSISWGDDSYDIIYMSLVREYISIDFNVKDEELELTIDDFIALSFLIGNDFIPYFHDIDIFNCYDDIINIYKTIRQSSIHLVEDGQFNKLFLKTFLQKIVNLLHQKYHEINPDIPLKDVSKNYTEYSKKWLSEKYPNVTDLGPQIKEMALSILDAFDWVLKYYREGCSCWRWCYKFHYSPPIEFIIPYIDEHVTRFKEDLPISPLLQLLCVIPPQSNSLLPKELQSLVYSDELKEYFPETFEVDQNPHNFRQTTVLIPIIDIDLLEQKFSEVHLSSDRLNALRFALEINGEGKEAEEVSISRGESPFAPVNLSRSLPPCMPTLSGLDFTACEKLVPVKVFRFPSSRPSIVLRVGGSGPKTVGDARKMMNETVLFNWPHLRPAKVVGMMDAACSLEPSSQSPSPITEEDAALAEEKRQELLAKEGVDVGQEFVFLDLLAMNSDGSFGDEIHLSPASLVVGTEEAPGVMGMFKREADGEPDINDEVVVCSGCDNCCTGRIVDKNGGGLFKVEMASHGPLRVAQSFGSAWIPFECLVRSVGHVSFRCLRQCLSKVILDGSNVNIALTLLTLDRRVVCGCCKRVAADRTYVFAGFVPQLVTEYFERAGNLKALLMESPAKIARVTPAMLYGGTQQHQEECLKRLTDWLAEKAPASYLPLVDEDDDFLPIDGLRSLESYVEAMRAESARVVAEFDRSLLVWKTKKSHKTQRVGVGQRVVSVCRSGPVPFGRVGTVVETCPRARAAFVLFDKELELGTRLDGRLRSKRASRVSIDDLVVVKAS